MHAWLSENGNCATESANRNFRSLSLSTVSFLEIDLQAFVIRAIPDRVPDRADRMNFHARSRFERNALESRFGILCQSLKNASLRTKTRAVVKRINDILVARAGYVRDRGRTKTAPCHCLETIAENRENVVD